MAAVVVPFVVSVVVNAFIGVFAYAAMTLLASKRRPNAEYNKTDRSVMIQSNDSTLPVVYGTAKLSGVLCFAEVTGTDKEYLHLVVALCDASGNGIEEVGEVFLNDESTDLDKFADNVFVSRHPRTHPWDYQNFRKYPPLTGGGTPSEYAISSSGSAQNAFDGDSETYCETSVVALINNGAYVGYVFETAKRISRVAIEFSGYYGTDIGIKSTRFTDAKLQARQGAGDWITIAEASEATYQSDNFYYANNSDGTRTTLTIEINPSRRDAYKEYRFIFANVNQHISLLTQHNASSVRFYAFDRWALMSETQGTETGDTQQADQFLMEAVPDKWTDNHQLLGIAYVYVRLKFDPDLFPTGVPNVSAIVHGRRVYDTRTSTTGYSENPALCIRDYLSNAAYGLGIKDANLPATLYSAAAEECDESVTVYDGAKDLEYTQKRYMMNGIAETDRRPLDNILDMLSTGMGALPFSAGAYCPKFQNTGPSTFPLTANDLRGPIKVLPKRGRREKVNQVKGKFTNPAKNWQPDTLPPRTAALYKEQDGGETHEIELDLPFTTNAQAAQRLAAIELKRGRQEIVCEFPAKLTALPIEVFDIIDVTISQLGWTNKKFRVMSWKLTIEKEDFGVDLSLEEYADSIATHSGTDIDPIDDAPNTDLPSPFQILAPVNLDFLEELYEASQSGGVKTKVTVSWARNDARASEYQLEWKLSTESTYVTHRTTGTSHIIFDAQEGTYNFRIKAVNGLGVSSSYFSKDYIIIGKSAPPENVSGLDLNILNNTAYLSWNQSVELDVKIGGYIVIRHSTKTTGAVWEDGVLIGRFPGISTSGALPLVTGTYMAKFVDSTGNYSTTAANIVTTVPSLLRFNVVSLVQEDSTFPGTKTNLVVVDGKLQLDTQGLFDEAGTFDSDLMFDDAAMFDEDGNFDSPQLFDSGEEGIYTTGTYLFASTQDLGAVYTSRLSADIEALYFNANDLFDSTETFDGSDAFDGDAINSSNVKLYVRTTNDNPGGSPTWSAWREFYVGEYLARAFQFKLEFDSGSQNYQIQVSRLRVTIDMPDRIDADYYVTVPNTGITITFSPAFYATPSVGITAHDMATGDKWELSSSSATQFSGVFKDSGGTGVTRTIDWMAKGYGVRT